MRKQFKTCLVSGLAVRLKATLDTEKKKQITNKILCSEDNSYNVLYYIYHSRMK